MTLSASRFAPALGWDGFGITEDVLLGPESHQMIRALCKGSPSVGRAPLPVLLWVLQLHALHCIWGFNFRDKVACVKISAPSTLGSKYFMMACWDMDGCSLTNWKTVIQSCKVKFSRAFFSRCCADDFRLSFLGFSWHTICGLYGATAGFSWGLHVSVRQLPICISEMTCGCFWKLEENPPKIFYMIMYTTPKGYTLYIIQRSPPPNMVPTQTLCIIRFIHYDDIHYEKVYCSGN